MQNIKSTVVETAVKPPKSYPYFGKSEWNVVLFVAPDTGVVVHQRKIGGEAGYQIGHWSCTWAEKNCFMPFHGNINIEVE